MLLTTSTQLQGDSACKHVAEVLGNTPATCRKFYIHPAVLEAYVAGTFFETIKRRRKRKAWKGLEPGEKSVMKLLLAWKEHKQSGPPAHNRVLNPFGRFSPTTPK